MGWAVLSPETFECSDIIAAEVLMCLVHPHCGSLLLQLYLMHWSQLLLSTLQQAHT